MVRRVYWFRRYIKKILKLSKKDILNSIIVLEKDAKMRKLNVDNFKSIDVDFDNSFKLLDTISQKAKYLQESMISKFGFPNKYV